MYFIVHFYQIANNQMEFYLYERERWVEDREEKRRGVFGQKNSKDKNEIDELPRDKTKEIWEF